MGYRFVSNKRWIRESIFAIIYVLTITILSVYSFLTFEVGDFTNPILSFILIVSIIVGIYRAIYYFKLPTKDYLIIEGRYLSIYRGNLIPRKMIQFDKVERVVQVNDIIIIKLSNGKEEQIYIEWLSNGDNIELKKELKHWFEEKAIAL
ncbi:hypothetical protein [Bacillus sp. JJ1562]|uniref:hypothetical protein n=1 Tax=Bacillus sp. JJ1562 TaxID=3122960 RepID=UPI0030026928